MSIDPHDWHAAAHRIHTTGMPPPQQKTLKSYQPPLPSVGHRNIPAQRRLARSMNMVDDHKSLGLQVFSEKVLRWVRRVQIQIPFEEVLGAMYQGNCLCGTTNRPSSAELGGQWRLLSRWEHMGTKKHSLTNESWFLMIVQPCSTPLYS